MIDLRNHVEVSIDAANITVAHGASIDDSWRGVLLIRMEMSRVGGPKISSLTSLSFSWVYYSEIR